MHSFSSFHKYLIDPIIYIKYFFYKPLSKKLSMKTDLLPTYFPAFIFNVLHIGSMIGLSLKVVNDYMRSTIFIEYDMVFLLMTVISMTSGKFVSLI